MKYKQTKSVPKPIITKPLICTWLLKKVGHGRMLIVAEYPFYMNIVLMSCLLCTALILSVAHGPIGLLRIIFFLSILSYLSYLSYPLGDWIHFVEFLPGFTRGDIFFCDFLFVFSIPATLEQILGPHE